MSKEMLKGLIELVPEEDIETIYKVIIKFIPEDKPLLDEIEAIERANKSIAENGKISHDAINWDQSKGKYKNSDDLSKLSKKTVAL